MISKTEELEKIIKLAKEEQFNNGRLQGIHEFYLMLRDTHKTPKEIYDYLLDNEIYSIDKY